MKKFFFLFFVSIISYGLFAQTLEKIESEVSFVSEVTLQVLKVFFKFENIPTLAPLICIVLAIAINFLKQKIKKQTKG